MNEPRTFLLSPASCSGRRAAILLNERAEFSLARRFHAGAGASIADVFTFLSGLYFRGKVAYSLAFGRPDDGVPAGLVITTSRGLLDPTTPVTPADVREFAGIDLDPADPRYRDPLLRDAMALADRLGGGSVVLLGSIASGKYTDLLLDVFGDRLLFPVDFVGRGDMSRGSLMLRAADAGDELEYAPVAGAVRHGARPPRLEPRRWPTKPGWPE